MQRSILLKIWSSDRARLLRGLALVCVLALSAGCANGTEAQESSATAPPPEEQAASVSSTSITTGTGELFSTTVERSTEGELSAEDFRQVSLLSSHVVRHVNSAVLSLEDGHPDSAREALDKSLTLIEVIRELLPKTVVTTVVRDAEGEEVYREVDRVQDDRIPLYEGLIAVEILEPIADAKVEQAAIKGLRLAEADLMHTSVLVELPYVERKLEAALRHIDEDETDEALAQLTLAQTRGISYQVNAKDDPLVQAHLALQLAERMVEQERHEAATANLRVAQNYLTIYRGLLGGKEGTEELRQIEDELSELVSDVSQEDAAARIRGIWDQVVEQFAQEPGEANPTQASTEEVAATEAVAAEASGK